MHQLERLAVRAHRAQSFYKPKAQPATAMHGKAAGLVDNNHPLVLEEDAACELFTEATRRHCRIAFGETHWRHPDAVACLKAAVGPGPAAVNPHLPSPNDAIHQRARSSLQPSEKEVVEPLTCVVGGDLNDPGTGRGFR
jgi:hypothetical protein